MNTIVSDWITTNTIGLNFQPFPYKEIDFKVKEVKGDTILEIPLPGLSKKDLIIKTYPSRQELEITFKEGKKPLNYSKESIKFEVHKLSLKQEDLFFRMKNGVLEAIFKDTSEKFDIS
jgi:HSP20 family molecular chaperone IbpA